MASGWVRKMPPSPLMLHTHLKLHADLTRKTNKKWVPSKKKCAFGNQDAYGKSSSPFYGKKFTF